MKPGAGGPGAPEDVRRPGDEAAGAEEAGPEPSAAAEPRPVSDGPAAPGDEGAAADAAAAGDKAPSPEEAAGEAARLQERVAALEARERELSDQYVRLLAEFDNYRRRTRQEMEALRATAAERLLTDVLPVLDSLDHALAAADEAAGPLGQGVKLIRQQLMEVLSRHGLMVIEAVGQPFDPNLMEAVAEAEPGDGSPAGHVVEEYRRGYRLQDKVLRPSLVKVAAAR